MHSGLQNTNAPRDKSNGVIKQYLSPRDISRVSYTISESQDFKGVIRSAPPSPHPSCFGYTERQAA